MGNVKIIVALNAILINKFKFEKLRNRKIEEKRKAQFFLAYRELCFSVNKYF